MDGKAGVVDGRESPVGKEGLASRANSRPPPHNNAEFVHWSISEICDEYGKYKKFFETRPMHQRPSSLDTAELRLLYGLPPLRTYGMPYLRALRDIPANHEIFVKYEDAT